VRILGPVIEMTPSFLAAFIPDDFHGGLVRSTLVRHDDVRAAIALHCFFEEFQRSSLIALLRDIGFQYFTLVIDSAP